MKNIIVLLFAVVALVGCSQNSKKEAATAAPAAPAATTQPATAPAAAAPVKAVSVDEINAVYKGVVIQVVEKKSGAKTDVPVTFGQVTKLGTTGLTVDVQTFLPDFTIMEDSYISKSVEANNPGAKVLISGKDSSYEGWLFRNFPDVHPYESADYGIYLVDVIKK